jgi:monoamine oxidase
MLTEHGVRVLILEARDRVGGRILSHLSQEGITVELGAEFIHGRAPELWALLDECGATTTERDGSMLREDWNDSLIEDRATENGDLFAPLDTLADLPGDDISFTDWLQTSDVPEENRPALLGYVEGFNAADTNRISARSLGVQQRAEDAIEGDRTWHVHGGYGQLTEFLARRVVELGGEIKLNCIVHAVQWRAGDAQIETSLGTFRAPQCIVALPLGVLQRANLERGICFDPELPALAAARRLAMGHVSRFTMIFRERWWESSSRLNADALRARRRSAATPATPWQKSSAFQKIACAPRLSPRTRRIGPRIHSRAGPTVIFPSVHSMPRPLWPSHNPQRSSSPASIPMSPAIGEPSTPRCVPGFVPQRRFSMRSDGPPYCGL